MRGRGRQKGGRGGHEDGWQSDPETVSSAGRETIGVELIAHRGFAAEAPENTLPALQRAASVADGLELDVRASADGTPVVVHDRTVDRVTDHSGPVSAYDVEELRSMSVQGSTAGIPTLEDVLGEIPDATPLLVECKEPRVARPVVESLEAHPGPGTIAAFDDAVLGAARRAAPTVPRALVAGGPIASPLTRAVEHDCRTVLLQAGLISVPSIRRAARSLDRTIFAWTVERSVTARLLAALGVDGLIADRSDVLSPWRRRS